jgi:hypothetical protein
MKKPGYNEPDKNTKKDKWCSYRKAMINLAKTPVFLTPHAQEKKE